MAVQSGSILLGYGDPLTPLYPAIGINKKNRMNNLDYVTDIVGIS